MMEEAAQELSFSEIARRWGEDSCKKLLCDDEGTASPDPGKWISILLQSAIWGGFDFVQPNEEAHNSKLSHTTSLRDSVTGTLVTSADLINRIEKALVERKLISNPDRPLLKSRDFESVPSIALHEIYSALSKELSVSQEHFLRWCRVELEYIIKQSDDMELVRPTFWGDAWDGALTDRIHLAAEGKRYLISEAPKFFLDPDVWDAFGKWTTQQHPKPKVSARQSNTFIEAQERFETYVKNGKISISGYPFPYQAGTAPEHLPAEKLALDLMKFDFSKSEAILGVSRYVAVGTQFMDRKCLEPAASSRRQGKLNARYFMVEDYERIMSDENERKRYLSKKGKLNKRSIVRAIWERMRKQLPQTGGSDERAYASIESAYNAFNQLLEEKEISIPPQYQ